MKHCFNENYVRQMALILEHFCEALLKDDVFLKNVDCQTYAVDQCSVNCNGAMVAIATTQVVLDLYQTF